MHISFLLCLLNTHVQCCCYLYLVKSWEWNRNFRLIVPFCLENVSLAEETIISNGIIIVSEVNDEDLTIIHIGNILYSIGGGLLNLRVVISRVKIIFEPTLITQIIMQDCSVLETMPFSSIQHPIIRDKKPYIHNVFYWHISLHRQMWTYNLLPTSESNIMFKCINRAILAYQFCWTSCGVTWKPICQRVIWYLTFKVNLLYAKILTGQMCFWTFHTIFLKHHKRPYKFDG